MEKNNTIQGEVSSAPTRLYPHLTEQPQSATHTKQQQRNVLGEIVEPGRGCCSQMTTVDGSDTHTRENGSNEQNQTRQNVQDDSMHLEESGEGCCFPCFSTDDTMKHESHIYSAVSPVAHVDTAEGNEVKNEPFEITVSAAENISQKHEQQEEKQKCGSCRGKFTYLEITLISFGILRMIFLCIWVIAGILIYYDLPTCQEADECDDDFENHVPGVLAIVITWAAIFGTEGFLQIREVLKAKKGENQPDEGQLRSQRKFLNIISVLDAIAIPIILGLTIWIAAIGIICRYVEIESTEKQELTLVYTNTYAYHYTYTYQYGYTYYGGSYTYRNHYTYAFINSLTYTNTYTYRWVNTETQESFVCEHAPMGSALVVRFGILLIFVHLILAILTWCYACKCCRKHERKIRNEDRVDKFDNEPEGECCGGNEMCETQTNYVNATDNEVENDPV